ncbi:MAG: type II toxin-antitoxin system VapC family toxin [Candidatus Korobacteraceae bacterium]
MLDTNAVIALFTGEPAAAQRFESDDAVFLCVHVLGELRYGALASSRVAENLARLERFTTLIPVLPCDAETVVHYADIRFGLRKRGKPIPENDIWIAAIARQHGLTLLSRDAHFRRIGGLELEVF